MASVGPFAEGGSRRVNELGLSDFFVRGRLRVRNLVDLSLIDLWVS